MSSWEHKEVKALYNLLVKKGIVTKEEYDEEFKRVRKSEWNSMRGIKDEESK